MNKMSIIRITNDKEIEEIDLTPVEEIAHAYENVLMKRENFLDRRHISYSNEILTKIKTLNKRQLEFLVTYLTGITNHYADLYQTALDSPEEFAKRIKDYKELFKKAKEIYPKIEPQ